MDVFSPTNAAEVAEVVADAAASGRKLDIRGNGSKASIGSGRLDHATLDVSAIAGIVDYDPAELVLTLRPGTQLAEVNALLAENDQMLAFEPLDLSPILGSDKGATIGGTVAAGLAGSRRLTRGGVRDHLLGFAAVSGRGEQFVAGGKVVKNVTGYDLSKLMAGSWGRLAVLTELTLKVLPAPRAQETLVVAGLSAAEAYRLMAKAMGSQAEVSAAAFLPAATEARSQTAFRLEGIAPSIVARKHLLADATGGNRLETLAVPDGFWTNVRDAGGLAGAVWLWRIILPARAMPDLALLLDAADATWMSDWAGGLVWAAWDGSAGMLRDRVASLGGQALLVRADAADRLKVPAFHPLPAALARLEARVCRAFDPAGVFDTGRFGMLIDAD
ncbi:glycolate oxidase subunit GlcE [Rhizorhabdus argentea]|uniref:glycolate oxidase subunit GlcE n=1 Tax=Rhizorhabdus argentea TaxID=1387174 RepID=UPI0030EF37DD